MDAIVATNIQQGLSRPLEGYGGERPPAPDWFQKAQAEPFSRESLRVAGCDLELLCWGERGKQGILLLHGSMAHAGWWAAVAPLLAKDYRVCSLSFSGMGGSGHRDRYSVAQMAQEAWAAMEVGGLFDGPLPPLVIPHSFGGKAACLMAGDPDAQRLMGIVFVDSFVVPQKRELNPPPYQLRYYASQDDALARFRLSPDQPSEHPYIIDAIARAGVKQVADGRWTWRFDPDFFRKLDFEDGWEELLDARCPLAFLRGEHSRICTLQEEAVQRSALRPDTLFIEMPDAYHHVMLDQPLALVCTLRAIAAAWATQLAAVRA